MTREFAHQLRFVDASAPERGEYPVLVTRVVLVDGDPLGQQFASFTIGQAGPDDPVIVTFHGVPAADITVERIGGDDDDPNYRVAWGGRGWLTPRDHAAIATILSAQAQPEQIVDFAVFCGELIIGGLDSCEIGPETTL